MDQATQALKEAERAGIDLSLIDINLALSVKERWEQHEAAWELALKLEAAGRKREAKRQSITGATR